MNSTTRQFVACARRNTFYTVPSLVVLFFTVVALHDKGWHEQERICCAVIGWLFGWCMALWGAALLASEYTKTPSDGDGTAEQSTPTGKQEQHLEEP